jgi:hypothetical protein
LLRKLGILHVELFSMTSDHLTPNELRSTGHFYRPTKLSLGPATRFSSPFYQQQHLRHLSVALHSACVPILVLSPSSTRISIMSVAQAKMELNDKEKTLSTYMFKESCCTFCQKTMDELDGKLMQCGKCKKVYFCSREVRLRNQCSSQYTVGRRCTHTATHFARFSASIEMSRFTNRHVPQACFGEN